MKPYAILILILVLFTGCASLPILEAGMASAETDRHYYYDIDSKIAYSITLDDENVYISLKTDNESTIRSLFRQGLYVYLDPNGKKNKDIYFNYPLTGKKRGPGGSGMMPRGQMQKVQGQQHIMPRFDVNDLIDNADMEAIYSCRKLAEKMPVYSQKTDISVTLSSPKEGLFLYELKIPLERIDKNEISRLAIGLETGTIEMPAMDGGPGGGHDGGGMQGGGKMGGSPPSGGMPGGGFGPQENMEKISIWFMIQVDPD